MTKIRKVAYLTVSVLLAVALLSVSIAITQAYCERWKAQQFLTVLRQIRIGSTDKASVIRMTDRFRSDRQEYEGENKTELGFLFYNGWATQLKLATPVEFRAALTIKDGVVIEKWAREASWAFGSVGAVREFSREIRYHNKTDLKQYPNHVVHWEQHPPQFAPDKFRRIHVEDDDTCPELQREKDWNFNLSCMTRLGRGCGDAREMLPNVAYEQPASQSVDQ